MERQTGKKTA